MSKPTALFYYCDVGVEKTANTLEGCLLDGEQREVVV